MPLPAAPTSKPNNQGNRLATRNASNKVLLAGLLCVLAGVALALSPRFIRSPALDGLAAVTLGWWLLATGCALIGWYAWRRLAAPVKP